MTTDYSTAITAVFLLVVVLTGMVAFVFSRPTDQSSRS